MFTIGCHLSSSKGYLNMAKEAVSINANTFQFFTRNPRGFSSKPIDENDIKSFLVYSKNAGINKILAHAPYTLNACSADPSIRDFAKMIMQDDLKRMEYTPGNLYNFHPGSHVKQGVEIGMNFIVDLLNEVLTEDMTTTVLLETMAGKGSEIGRNFEEIAEIIKRVNLSDKLGVCLDTCHVWEAGYDVVNNLENVLSDFNDIVGIDRIKAIHLNDSKNPIGSAKDRHECIGKGHIGLESLTRIINNQYLKKLPFYLETPQDLNGYKEEIKLLRSLYNNENL